MRNLIRENKTPLINSIIQTSRADGMITMDNSLLDLFRKGLITKENALLYSVDKKTLARQIAEA